MHVLAQTGRLPDHQYLDQHTLTWIAGHRPTGPGVRATMPHRPVLLVPDDSWFASPAVIDSIHGSRHNARVALLVQLLAHHHGLDHGSALALAAAAACHDCRRHHDRDDPGHGQRAARWLAGNLDTVAAAFGKTVTAETITAVYLHDHPYDAFTDDQARAYRRSSLLVDLLKAADALDRYRLPLARWWPDLSRLRVAVPAWLLPIAFDLVLHSEQARLDGAAHREALDHALHTVLPE
ncbi:hypothetical protein [Kitasatospora aureofaciens]|uniref:hypothetical protein n=1 Tax=Kitasatospora aureofaciens TaxID=1894 RepID=UPI00210DDFE4|nr:hypothetical protein [Kitasatospora aureofaciens]